MIQITIPSELAPLFRSEMPAAWSSPSLGKWSRARSLVTHTDRRLKVRIISARLMTKYERRIYEEG